MTKPTVFNYQDYVALEAQIADLREENDRLREKVANLEIRCRIAEEALTESQKNLLNLAMDHNLLQLTINRTWIPVCEKLPENGFDDIVLVSVGYNMEFGRCNSKGEWFIWSFADWLHCDKVLAWMPLPEPYKEDVND